MDLWINFRLQQEVSLMGGELCTDLESQPCVIEAILLLYCYAHLAE